MQFLTEMGEALDLNVLPATLTTDVHFAALVDDDFQFFPLIFLECWRAPVATVTIAGTSIDLPSDLSIAVFCHYTGDVETVTIATAGNFDAFGFDPLRSSMAIALPMTITIGEKRDWRMPRRSNGMTVAVPVGTSVIWVGGNRTHATNIADLL